MIGQVTRYNLEGHGEVLITRQDRKQFAVAVLSAEASVLCECMFISCVGVNMCACVMHVVKYIRLTSKMIGMLWEKQATVLAKESNPTRELLNGKWETKSLKGAFSVLLPKAVTIMMLAISLT